MLNDFKPTNYTYISSKHQLSDYHITMSRHQAASLVAASFLCLFSSSHHEQQFLLNEPNFTYFYRGIGLRLVTFYQNIQCRRKSEPFFIRFSGARPNVRN